MFSQMIQSLRMENSFDMAGPLIDAHLTSVRDLLQEFICSDDLITENLKAGLSELPPASIGRLITSPYLCELLMILKEVNNQDLTAVKQHIVQGLVAEILLVNPDAHLPFAPKWTFDGDVVLDTEVAQQFPALQTNCGIRLNYQSYAHNTGKPDIGGYDFKMGLKHKERIEYGKRIVQQVSASAASLVDSVTVAIQFRLNNNRPNIVNSSTHTSIGLIRCDNFHLLHQDMPEIVDMLVHESIHQYLHLFEERVFAFVERERACKSTLDDRRYPSPWSGKPLDLQSYTHAILVWYGLWHFWSQVEHSGFSDPELTPDQIRDKIQEAAVGFTDTDSVLSNLGESSGWLNGDYAQQIERIQEDVRSA